MNLNHLGDSVMGNEESDKHMASYKADLETPLIDYISVKISTLYPHISALAHEHTVAHVSARLKELFLVAKENKTADGHSKFVNLDMEGYIDLELTLDAFKKVLSEPELMDFSAGIVLQAYLPDSFQKQQELTEWAKNRLSLGGAPIKLRIVKGANMAMEKIEAASKGWPQAPYTEKSHTDANYYRMVEYGMQPDNIQAVRLGIASHNLFSIANTYELGKERGVEGYYTFEMLEGMADHIRRALQSTLGEEVLLYAPLAKQSEILSALGYLMRRLDENTSSENFLSRSFGLTVGSANWEFLRHQYENAYLQRGQISSEPRRNQNRLMESPKTTDLTMPFANEQDTDFSLAANREWATMYRTLWMKKSGADALKIGPLLADSARNPSSQERTTVDAMDPSRPGVVIGQIAQATDADCQSAITAAQEDRHGWREKTCLERAAILLDVAGRMRKERGNLIGVSLANTGKTFAELDSEVSEAIDFLEYYARSIAAVGTNPSVRTKGKGVGLVIAPWNFPVAIPAGGIAASLAAGNTTIFKPAPEAALAGAKLVECFYMAGVPVSALQFLPCTDASAAMLTKNDGIDFLIFTGSTDTAMRIRQSRTTLEIAAETGGKNATIVTSMADREQAIKNIVQSAFSNSGQKCSATSLVILVGKAHEDPLFKKQLKDAVTSLITGSSWNFETDIGPLVREPEGALLQSLTTLHEGEEWLIEPVIDPENHHLVSPGVKWGVRAGSFDHQHELFGPCLSVMHAHNLEEAIEITNQTGYGLTSGLESLCEKEQAQWKKNVQAGNLYINRPTTGAIVQRQPFGGMGKSAMGLGIKAGGPNYLLQFMNVTDGSPEKVSDAGIDAGMLEQLSRWQQLPANENSQSEMKNVLAAAGSYAQQIQAYFSQEHDPSRIRGEDNHLRYLPAGTVTIRIDAADSFFDNAARTMAALAAGNHVVLSIGEQTDCLSFVDSLTPALRSTLQIVQETDEELAARIAKNDRIRYAQADRVPAIVADAAARQGSAIISSKPLVNGKIELSIGGYLREQVISDRFHRYGNLLHRDPAISH